MVLGAVAGGSHFDWGPFILLALTGIATVFGWLGKRIFDSLDRTQDIINNMDRRLSRIEGRMRIDNGDS